MSYQVLARKWRPRTFKDLIGQEPVTKILTNSLMENRLHPALIFAGPRGTGKTSTARILAKTLNCPQTKNAQACNECKSCHDINVSRHVDVMEIDGASNNGVDAVRNLKETISYIPTGAVRVYIIDEVHMLSVSAFNALLKTLEEPPPKVVFIMATTEMRKIPLTVLSRCQILQFQRISDSLIFHQLQMICTKEKVKTSEEALWMLTREAEGSLRDAQGLLDQMIAFCDNTFADTDVSKVLGLSDRYLLMNTLYSLLKKNSTQLLKNLTQLHIKGADPSLFLRNLIQELRNLLLLKTDMDGNLKVLLSLSEKEQSQMKKHIDSNSIENLHLLFDMALKGAWEINRIQDTKVYLEVLLLRMCQAPHIEPLFSGEGDFSISPSQQQGKKSMKPTTPSPHTSPISNPPPAKPKKPIDVQPENESPLSPPPKGKNKTTTDINWSQAVHFIKDKNPYLANIAKHLFIKLINKNEVTLCSNATKGFIFDKQKESAFQSELKSLLSNYQAGKWKFIFDLPLKLDSQSRKETTTLPPIMNKKQDNIKDDSYIKQVQQIFDADILDP